MLQEAELSAEADSENNLGGSSETMYYIGLNVHKKTIGYCVKDAAGCALREGKIGSTRGELDAWIKKLLQSRMMAMEATIFTGLDLRPFAVWDAASGKLLLTPNGHRTHVYSVAWSPDGKRLATGSADQTAKVWGCVERAGNDHPGRSRRQCKQCCLEPGRESAW